MPCARAASTPLPASTATATEPVGVPAPATRTSTTVSTPSFDGFGSAVRVVVVSLSVMATVTGSAAIPSYARSALVTELATTPVWGDGSTSVSSTTPTATVCGTSQVDGVNTRGLPSVVTWPSGCGVTVTSAVGWLARTTAYVATVPGVASLSSRVVGVTDT